MKIIITVAHLSLYSIFNIFFDSIFFIVSIVWLLWRDRDFFGKALNDHIDPDVTVAYGAASILD